MRLRVECRTGSHGEQVPDRIHLDRRSVDVETILDRWAGEDYLYFKLRGAEGNLYILKFDEKEEQWELTLFESAWGTQVAEQHPEYRQPRKGS